MYRILWSATAASRVEWYFNGIRMRHTLHASKLSLLPSGTTSNEALHAEINRWFRTTAQMHQATLALKLRILNMGKLLAHNSAMYRCTARGMAHSVVLARTAMRNLWTPEGWRSWCSTLHIGSGVRKASLRRKSEKDAQKKTLREWVLKRPAASYPATAPPTKRTAFNLMRTGSFIKGGVKNTVYARPARS